MTTPATVAQIGTPLAPIYTNHASSVTAATLAQAWSATQPRAAGNLLVALLAFPTDNPAGTSAFSTDTPGWAEVIQRSNNNAASDRVRSAVWAKVADGGDVAPTFTAPRPTAAIARSQIALLELSATGLPPTAAGFTNTGAAGAAPNWSVATAAAVPAAGGFAVSVISAMTFGSFGLGTWTPGAGWSSLPNDAGSNTLNLHSFLDTRADVPAGVLTNAGARSGPVSNGYFASVAAVFGYVAPPVPAGYPLKVYHQGQWEPVIALGEAKVWSGQREEWLVLA